MNLVSIQHKLKQLNWLMVIFTMLVFSSLIKLGFWQIERALEKEQRQERIQALSQRDALSLAQVKALEGLQVLLMLRKFSYLIINPTKGD